MELARKTLELWDALFEQKRQEKEREKAELFDAARCGKIKIAIFGAGHIGRRTYRLLSGYGCPVDCFIDNGKEKWGKEIVDGVSCNPPGFLLEHSPCFAVVALADVDAVSQQLKDMGIKSYCKHICEMFSLAQNDVFALEKDAVRKKIECAFSILADCDSKKIFQKKIQGILMNMEELKEFSYADVFSKEIYCPELLHMNKEYIVDCGAYQGDTLQYFRKEIGAEKICGYYAFELNRKNFVALKKYVGSLPVAEQERIEVFNYGVSDRAGEIFYSDDTNASRIGEDAPGQATGELARLDDCLRGKQVSYIKMDVEGSEIPALEGARDILSRQMPKLAVCLYHRMTDLWEIPLLIHDINPRYRIYIRHHSMMSNETVCYAVAGA